MEISYLVHFTVPFSSEKSAIGHYIFKQYLNQRMGGKNHKWLLSIFILLNKGDNFTNSIYVFENKGNQIINFNFLYLHFILHKAGFELSFRKYSRCSMRDSHGLFPD